MGVGEDRISALYDPLIHHIFSFLPMESVVATSVLSKRWKNLWISTPAIDIRNWRPRIKPDKDRMLRYNETYALLVSFLDRMLRPSNNMPTIKKFYFNYHAYCIYGDIPLDKKKIPGWISTLIMRKVEELSLCIPKYFVLPPCLFTSETLTMLEIEMSGDLSDYIKKKGTLGFPPAISFPRLKVLHLKHMVFVDESLDAQLFSNSPVLEELMLTNSYMMKKKVLNISVASLKRLIITNSKTYWCKLNIHAPNLQSLTYNGMPEDYVLLDHGFSSLVDADINIVFEMLGEKTIGRKARKCGLKNLLGGISNANLLRISGSTLESLLYEGFSTLELPTYHNLRQLEVSSKMSSSATTALIDLLSFLPNLESIVIAKGFFKLKKVDDSGKQKVPECLLLQLKAVKVREFYGSRREQNIISFFLKESLVLQTMDIVFSSTLAERWKDSQTLPQSLKDSSNLSQILKDGVMQRILTFPKGSTDCAINFSS